MPTILTPLALAAAAFLADPVASAHPGRSEASDALVLLRRSAPQSTVVWLESNALEPILREGLGHPLVKQLLRDPLVVSAMKRDGVDLVEQADALQALLGRSPFAFAHALASGGVAAGFTDLTPGSEAPFLLVHGSDADEMEEAIDELESLLRGFQLLGSVSSDKSDPLAKLAQRTWRVRAPGSSSDMLCAAWTRAGTLVVTKEWDDLAAWCKKSNAPSSIDVAHRAITSPTSAFAWFDLDAIEEQADLADLRAMAADPGTHFVLGPAIAYAGLASTASAALLLQEDEISITLRADGVDPGEGAGLFPSESAAGMRVPTGSLGIAQLHRDANFLLSHRTKLFPPRTQPAFAEALSNLALLVGGPDALDDLLAAIHPSIRLHALEVEFPENATPDVPLPGLNVIASLDDPELNGGRLNSAFQAAISLTNLEAAMQGKEALRLALQMIDGVTLTTAKLTPPAPGSSVDLRFNFSPGCALMENEFVFGTRHEGVTHFIKNASSANARRATAAMAPWIEVDYLSVSGPALAGLASEQRDLLVMRAVLEDGKPQARAEAEADILIRLLGQVDQIQYGSSWRPAGESERSLQAELAFHLKH